MDIAIHRRIPCLPACRSLSQPVCQHTNRHRDSLRHRLVIRLSVLESVRERTTLNRTMDWSLRPVWLTAILISVVRASLVKSSRIVLVVSWVLLSRRSHGRLLSRHALRRWWRHASCSGRRYTSWTCGWRLARIKGTVVQWARRARGSACSARRWCSLWGASSSKEAETRQRVIRVIAWQLVVMRASQALGKAL